MALRIYNNESGKEIEPIAIFFLPDGTIYRVLGCDPGSDPVQHGWYDLQGAALFEHIAIEGGISFNKEKMPKP